MVDLHTHLLPGVDDGSPSIEASRPVLERFASEGVETVVCTPHLDASRADTAPRERNAALLAELAAAVPNGPRLVLGWEIMLDEPGIDLKRPSLALGSSSAVLVEFPRTGAPESGARELFRIRMSGAVPVLAHPERYWGCTAAAVREWKQVGAVIQLDAVTLFGRSALSMLAHQLVQEGLVDCMASDNHADRRSLAAARKWLTEVASERHAELLTRENPGRVLRDEPMVPVPPLEQRRGMVERLREVARSLGVGRRRDN